MTLNVGTRLGPYEILSPLGAGGMGDVYRARDSRLAREVAIKVLPASFSNDADRLRRFEQEAKAAGLLNHPNITAVYDIGSHEGAPYVVSELLEGETLRAALAGGRLSPRKSIDYALQMAHGLAAAHEKGIVHRDLKPENLFVTKDGRVKILDFVLAKLTHAEEGSGEKTNLPTAAAGTEPGVVLGTLGYMAPEQVRGRQADVRSDIFSFGAILYEMLSGKRAFHGDSAADTMSAILREDPPELSLTNQSLPAGLERIVRHCLEKNPEQRFHSAHDLAFDLESLSGLSTPGARPVTVKPGPSRRGPLGAAAVAVLAAAIAVSFLAGRRVERRSAPAGPSFSQLTFRQQPIFKARFAPDGKTIVFSAATKGNTPEIFSLRPASPGATARGLPGVPLLAISSKGELAVLTRARYIGHNLFDGTLARMPLEGAAPREILEGVREADWSPDGADLAIIRDLNGKDRLEFPAGKVLCEASGYLSDLRFSPKGDRIAFFEHAIKYDDRGLVAVVDLSGKKTVLSEGYWGEEGLAWEPHGEEVLFSAGTAYNNFKIYAITLSGRRRVASDSAGGLTIHDAGAGGRWLVTRDDFFREMFVLAPGAKDQREAPCPSPPRRREPSREACRARRRRTASCGGGRTAGRSFSTAVRRCPSAASGWASRRGGGRPRGHSGSGPSLSTTTGRATRTPTATSSRTSLSWKARVDRPQPVVYTFGIYLAAEVETEHAGQALQERRKPGGEAAQGIPVRGAEGRPDLPPGWACRPGGAQKSLEPGVSRSRGLSAGLSLFPRAAPARAWARPRPGGSGHRKVHR